MSETRVSNNVTEILMISSAAGESGIGDYVEDLSKGITDSKLSHLIIPMGCNNPLVFAKIAVQAALSGTDLIHVQHEYGQFGKKSLMSLVFFPVLYAMTAVNDTPVVLTVHEALNEDLVTTPFKSAKELYIQVLNRATVSQADHVIFLSETSAEEMKRSVTVGSHSILPHGVRNEPHIDISKEEAKVRLGYDADSVLIAEPGYVEPRKGNEKLLELAKRFSEYEFVIAGGPAKPAYQSYYDRMARESPSNLVLTGRLDKTQFHTTFAASDLIILPYQGVSQGGVMNSVSQSGILNRCATYGKPTITSDEPYFRDIEDEWGCIVTCDFEDVEGVKRTVEDLIEDEARRVELSKAIGRFAEAHSFRSVGQEHERIYERILVANG